MMLSGNAYAPPTPIGSAVVDQHAATLGALGVVAALYSRQQTGQGAKVDSNLLSAALDLQLEPFNYHLNGANLYERSASGISSRFHQAPYGVYETADGWLTLSLADGATLATAFDDVRFAKWTKADQFTYREEVNQLVAAHMLTRTTSEWVAHLDTVGIWNAEVRDYDAVLADPQVEHNGSVVEFDLPRAGRVRLLNHPVRYNDETLGVWRLPPDVGENTDEVLGELGYTEQEIAQLRNAQAIGPDRAAHPFDRVAEAPESAYSRKAAR
jgi:crotonobetainyl-CoA:carnitine CoA-transferase CaiB-like acyl-CoA transferase